MNAEQNPTWTASAARQTFRSFIILTERSPLVYTLVLAGSIALVGLMLVWFDAWTLSCIVTLVFVATLPGFILLWFCTRILNTTGWLEANWEVQVDCERELCRWNTQTRSYNAILFDRFQRQEKIDCVVTEYIISNDRSWKTFEGLSLLRKLKHDNIGIVYGLCMVAGFKYPLLVVEAFGIPLNKFIKKHFNSEDGIPFNTKLSICLSVCSGMQYLHEEAHLLHGDLRTPSIHVRQINGTSLIVKIFDVQKSRSITGKPFISTISPKDEKCFPPEVICDTENSPHYNAQLQKNEFRLTKEVDVFCVGSIVIQVFSGRNPEPNSREECLKKALKGSESVEIARRENDLKRILHSNPIEHAFVECFVNRCMCDKPKKRATFAELKCFTENELRKSENRIRMQGSGQSILQPSGVSPPCSPCLDQNLDDALVALLPAMRTGLSLVDLLPRLERRAGGFMGRSEKIEVEEQPISLLKVDKIVGILRTKSNKDFDRFLSILDKSGNEHWKKTLRNLSNKSFGTYNKL